MDEHRSGYRAEGIYYAVCREAHHLHTEGYAVEYEAQPDKGQTREHGIDDHSLDVELQRLFSLGSNSDHTDADKLDHLAACHGVEHLETSEQVEDELRDAVVCRNRQIHHNLYYEEYIDAATEVVVHLLLFTGFFKSH